MRRPVAAWLCTQPTSRVLPCRLAGARKPQRAACVISASWASKRFNRVYKRCAHSAHHAHSVYRIRASSGLTARHVIYRCAASRPWRINVFSRRLPTYTCKAGLRNRTVRRATGEKSSMVCGALWHGVPSICLQNGLLHPYIILLKKIRCAATCTRGEGLFHCKGGWRAAKITISKFRSSARPDLRITRFRGRHRVCACVLRRRAADCPASGALKTNR